MRLFLLSILAFALACCATREVGTVRGLGLADPPVDEEGSASRGPCVRPKVVFVTIDGTADTPVARTAAARLHEMVEAYAYTGPGSPLAVWYAEGVGSVGHDIAGKVLGVGVNEDIKKAYAFLTRVWQPCDRLFLNGFSRGAYSIRALGGLLYMAGIPDLSGMSQRERDAIVDRLFDAYKTRTAYPGPEGLARRRAQRIAAVYARLPRKVSADPDRKAGFGHPGTKVAIEAITVWDTVHAIGLPDGSEDPLEGPAYFLLTACNARAIFQPLALDDNRAYSFTPILAGGDQATQACRGRPDRQNVSETIEEVWFSGAHADVGGTYSAGAMLDGELASVSLNWVLDRLRSPKCPGCGEALALPAKLRVPENRLTAVHDGKRTSIGYRKLYLQSRKPSVYWYRVYGPGKPVAVHASVFQRFDHLFQLDRRTAGCRGTLAPGKPVLCARQIASHGLIPELLKGIPDPLDGRERPCLEVSDWGYRLKADQKCVDPVGDSAESEPAKAPACPDTGQSFDGMVYTGHIKDAAESLAHDKFVTREPFAILYPRCETAEASPPR
ncbi:MAG TPA: DUF2235 domain-containing protein [Allosphingosinicella sp.]